MEVNVLERMFFAISVWAIVEIRITTTAAATAYLHKLEIKKRRKGQSLYEWFSYGRFREELPKGFLHFYYTVINLNIIAMAIVFFCSQYEMNANKIMMFVIIINSIWMIFVSIRSTNYKTGHTDFQNWVPKPKKKKRKK